MAAAKVPFKKGDVVQLKSGGPKMTVTSVTEAHRVKRDLHSVLNDLESLSGGGRREYDDVPASVGCTWFRGATREIGAFDPEIIKLVEG